MKIKCYICKAYYREFELLEIEIKKYICAKCYVKKQLKENKNG